MHQYLRPHLHCLQLANPDYLLAPSALSGGGRAISRGRSRADRVALCHTGLWLRDWYSHVCVTKMTSYLSRNYVATEKLNFHHRDRFDTENSLKIGIGCAFFSIGFVIPFRAMEGKQRGQGAETLHHPTSEENPWRRRLLHHTSSSLRNVCEFCLRANGSSIRRQQN